MTASANANQSMNAVSPSCCPCSLAVWMQARKCFNAVDVRM
jgi:hypothetical protein